MDDHFVSKMGYSKVGIMAFKVSSKVIATRDTTSKMPRRFDGQWDERRVADTAPSAHGPFSVVDSRMSARKGTAAKWALISNRISARNPHNTMAKPAMISQSRRSLENSPT